MPPMTDPYMQPMIHNPGSITFEDTDFEDEEDNGKKKEMTPEEQCKSIRSKAYFVAKNIVRRQNKLMFKTLLNYLLKSKFLIGMTEIKLSRVLRKKFLATIKQFSHVSEDNIRLIQSKDEELIDDELDLEEDEELQDGSSKIDFDDEATQESN